MSLEMWDREYVGDVVAFPGVPEPPRGIEYAPRSWLRLDMALIEEFAGF